MGGAVVTHMGDDDSSPARITGWDPPRRFVYEEPDWADARRPPDAPRSRRWSPSSWSRRRSGGTCVVRVVTQRLRHRRRLGAGVLRRDGDGLDGRSSSTCASTSSEFPGQRATRSRSRRHHRRRRRRGIWPPPPAAWACRPRRAGRRAGRSGRSHRRAPGRSYLMVEPTAPVRGYVRLDSASARRRRASWAEFDAWLFGPRPTAFADDAEDGWRLARGPGRSSRTPPFRQPPCGTDRHDRSDRRRQETTTWTDDGPLAIETDGLVKALRRHAAPSTASTCAVARRHRLRRAGPERRRQDHHDPHAGHAAATPTPARRASSATTSWPRPPPCAGSVSLTGQFASVDEELTGRENLLLLGRLLGLRQAPTAGARRRAARRVRPGRRRRQARVATTRAACAGGSTSPPASSSRPTCCSSTSRRPGSIRAAATRSGTSCACSSPRAPPCC